jgi:hypothetical protein
MRKRFENVRIARMASGDYKVIRNLGLVKGGKGLRSHEVLFTFPRLMPASIGRIYAPLSSLLNRLFAAWESRPVYVAEEVRISVKP